MEEKEVHNMDAHIEIRGHEEFPCEFCGGTIKEGWRILYIERFYGVDHAGYPFDSTNYYEMPNFLNQTRFKTRDLAEKIAEGWAERLNVPIKEFVYPGDE